MSEIKNFSKKVIQLAVVAVATFSLSGCATMFGDNTRTISIDSVPRGAGIYVNGQRQGTTPAVITMPNYIYGGKTITLKKEGYHEQTFALNTKFQTCGLLNLFFWPGFLIDAAVGNSVKIDPMKYNSSITLGEIQPPMMQPAQPAQAQ